VRENAWHRNLATRRGVRQSPTILLRVHRSARTTLVCPAEGIAM